MNPLRFKILLIQSRHHIEISNLLEVTGALSSKSFKGRFKIILGKFLENSPYIELKDPKRSFDEGQKLAIYYRDNGKCQLCKINVPINDSEFDHVIPLSQGGLTTVNNGQLLCKACNRRKGDKFDKCSIKSI